MYICVLVFTFEGKTSLYSFTASTFFLHDLIILLLYSNVDYILRLSFQFLDFFSILPSSKFVLGSTGEQFGSNKGKRDLK